MSLPIILICGCQKYRVYLEAAIGRMKRAAWEVIGFVGGDELSFDDQSRILTLPVEDTYEKLPAKLNAAITWIFQNYPEIPGIFKTDDDIVFDQAYLEKTIQANLKLDYWGMTVDKSISRYVDNWRINNRFDDKTLRPIYQTATYCYGGGYWLSMNSVSKVVQRADEYDKSALEDVCTGYVLNSFDIYPTCIKIPHQEVPRSAELLAL